MHKHVPILKQGIPIFRQSGTKNDDFYFPTKTCRHRTIWKYVFPIYSTESVFFNSNCIFIKEQSSDFEQSAFFPFYVFVNKARRILVLLWQDSRFNWKKTFFTFLNDSSFLVSLSPLSLTLSRAQWNKWWRERVCGSKWVCVRYLLTHMWVECNFRLDSFKLNKPTYCIHRFSFFPICLWKNRLGSNQQS